MNMKPSSAHYFLAGLEQHDLIARIRQAADDPDLLLWEMIELNNIYTAVVAGPITAQRLRISEGEIIGYHVPDFNRVVGSAFGDAMVQDPAQAPDQRDVIGTLRWRFRLAGPHS